MYRTFVSAVLAAAVVVAAAGVASAATAMGTIQKIDAKAHTLVVKVGKADGSFTLESTGKVMDGGKAISLDGLRTGEPVSVVYKDAQGQHLASRVDVHKPVAASQHKTPPKRPSY